MVSKALFSHAKDNWRTPRQLFDLLDKEFGFTWDVAADENNHLCENWLGPGSQWPDALRPSWTGMVAWCNPPYSMVKQFVEKAAIERTKGAKTIKGKDGVERTTYSFVGCTTVMLIPSRTDTRWFHDHIWDHEKNCTRPGVELRFIKGRLKFINPDGDLRKGHTPNSAPFPSMVVIFRGEQQ